jgi:hypothetical protein
VILLISLSTSRPVVRHDKLHGDYTGLEISFTTGALQDLFGQPIEIDKRKSKTREKFFLFSNQIYTIAVSSATTQNVIDQHTSDTVSLYFGIDGDQREQAIFAELPGAGNTQDPVGGIEPHIELAFL